MAEPVNTARPCSLDGMKGS